MHLIGRLARLIPLALILVMVASIIGPGVAKADPGWYDTAWQYRKQITINSANVSGSTNLTDFPVLINFVDSDLASDAQNDGDDILFTAADEVTKLSHEIENYNGTSGNLTAWVKIPGLSATSDTDIYMYYGNGSVINQEDVDNVWDSNFKMVQHLEESSGGANAITDSTTNNNDGTDYNTPTFGATGQVNGSITFDGTSEYVGVNDSTSLSITDNITVEAWVKGSSQAYKVFAAHCDSGVNQLSWKFYSAATTKMRIDISDDGTYDAGHRKRYDSSIDVFDNNWHYVVFTFDDTLRMYIDGQEDTNLTKVYDDAITSLHDSTVDVLMAAFLNSGTPAQHFNGTIDEVRVSNNARSADWLKTSYNNQNNPGDFLTRAAEENAPSLPTVTTSAATSVEEDSATLNGNITATGGENADTRGFEWDTDTGAPYSSNWTQSGSYGTGAFTHGLTSLSKGQIYYYRAMAHNSAGWGYGSEASFLTKPDPPNTFTATTASSSKIDLSWTKGDGAVRTMVRGKQGSYPADRTDGYQVYFDTANSASDTSLLPNTTYYYRAWSEVTTGSTQWSDTFDGANATTSSGAPVAVGGIVLKVNKAVLLAPWILLTAIMTFVLFRFILYLRKRARQRKSPHNC